MSLITKKRKRSEVNIVPLIDVLIVLIFFFLMTMHFKDLKALNITPPKIETAGKAEAEYDIVLSIDKTGLMHFNDQEISQDSLIDRLEEQVQRQNDPNILLIADEEVSLKFVTYAMDTFRKNNFYKIRLQSR